MITKFKIFEGISVPYKVGDFLLITLLSKGVTYKDVLVKIIKFVGSHFSGKDIHVQVLDTRIEKMFPKDKKVIIINDNYIKCWSSDRKELETLITLNKYNL